MKDRPMSYIIYGIVILCLGFMFSACKTLFVPTYEGPVSDHFNGKRFYNPPPFQMGKFKDLSEHNRKNKKKKWYYQEQTHSGDTIPSQSSKGEVQFVHINHASVLIQIDGINVLTDPVYSKRASPFQWAGPKRYREAGIAFEDLPAIDYVFISHDHYDHLDIPTLKKLARTHNPKFIVGLGLKGFLKKFKITNVREMDWWEKEDAGNGVTLHFLPARHWSNRFASPGKTLWGSLMIEGSKTLYHAGDTGYGPHFTEIAERFESIDAAFIPIGAYVPRSFMLSVHMDPQHAVRAFRDLKSDYGYGVHWGTFQLTGEAMFDPMDELNQEVKRILKEENVNLHFEVDKEPGYLHKF